MKKFIFRFVITRAFEVVLDEDQIYPDVPWYFCPEHHGARRSARLTAARVQKTVRANGGARVVLHDWNLGNLGTQTLEGILLTSELMSSRVRLSVRPAPRFSKRRPRSVP